MRLLFYVFCICLTSCFKPGDKIKDADKIEIFYFYKGDTLKYTDTSQRIITSFRKVLNGKTEKTLCEPSGQIIFFSKDKLILELEFSINGGDKGCQFLIDKNKAWRLSYAAGMFLSETNNNLKKE